MAKTKPIPYDKSAKAAYSKEVASLNAQLNIAKKNSPRERQAQVLAKTLVSQKRQENPNMDKAVVKKITKQAVDEARVRTGAHKTLIKISNEEWNAIQAGAITSTKLNEILQHADMELVKKHALPKQEVLMTSAKRNRALSMAASGFTQAEIAHALGVSLTTLKEGIA
jgi:DNA-binding NarL/FixJ family response regulator